MENSENLERAKRFNRYLDYRDCILEGDVLTRAQHDEYRSLEREFLRQERSRVVETEAHEEEMAGAPKMDNVASTSNISSLQEDDIPFKPVIKTNDDFIKVPHDKLASTPTSTGDDKPFTPRVITSADIKDLRKERAESATESDKLDFHNPKDRRVSPLSVISEGVSQLNSGLDSNKIALWDDSIDIPEEIAHGGSTNAGQAHMLNLSPADYERIFALTIDGEYYGAKVLRAIQERRANGEDYMDIVEVAKAGDAEKLNKLLSEGYIR